jgi:hypothetical protein
MLHSTASDVQAWLASTDPIPVVPLDDPVVDGLGHTADSGYSETYWLPVIGPTALWALRRLNRWLEGAPRGYPLVLGPLARELGLGNGTGRNSPVVRSLARLVCFGLAEVRGGQLMVRRRVPPLAHRHVRRLPAHLVERHRAETEAIPTPTLPSPGPGTRTGGQQRDKVAGGRSDPVGEASPAARRTARPVGTPAGQP